MIQPKGHVGIWAAILLGLTACDPFVPSLSDEKAEAAREQLEVYVAAARAAEDTGSAWPEDVEALESGLWEPPASPIGTIRIGELAVEEGILLMDFFLQERSDEEAADARLSGTVAARPYDPRERIVAQVEWRYAGVLYDRRGRWTIEYEPEEEPGPVP